MVIQEKIIGQKKQIGKLRKEYTILDATWKMKEIPKDFDLGDFDDNFRSGTITGARPESKEKTKP